MVNHHTGVWRRNQLVAALWHYLATARDWGGDQHGLAESVPRVFRSRVKKMLDLDRLPHLLPWEENQLPPDQWAFYDQAGEGTGSEERFSTVHAFNMGLALQMLNIGLKQSEVIFVLKWARPDLEAVFKKIHAQPGALAPVSDTRRQSHEHKHYPSSKPIWLEDKKSPEADFTVWMLLQRVETKELHPSSGERATEGQAPPMFMAPEFCFGLEAVKTYVFKHLNDFPHLVLLELADLALTLPRELAQAPAIGRGRPGKAD